MVTRLVPFWLFFLGPYESFNVADLPSTQPRKPNGKTDGGACTAPRHNRNIPWGPAVHGQLWIEQHRCHWQISVSCIIKMIVTATFLFHSLVPKQQISGQRVAYFDASYNPYMFSTTIVKHPLYTVSQIRAACIGISANVWDRNMFEWAKFCS